MYFRGAHQGRPPSAKTGKRWQRWTGLDRSAAGVTGWLTAQIGPRHGVQGHVYLASSKARVEQRGAQTEAYANSNSRRRHASERAHARYHWRHMMRTFARKRQDLLRTLGHVCQFDFAAAAPVPRALLAGLS